MLSVMEGLREKVAMMGCRGKASRAFLGVLLPVVTAALGSGGCGDGDWDWPPTITYVKASNTEAFDNFGYSVAICGDTVVVGAQQEDSGATAVNGDQNDNSTLDNGAAYVFTRHESGWFQEGYLKPSVASSAAVFGWSVAVSGDTIVVGTPEGTSGGAAYVFVRDGVAWSEQARLLGSNTEWDDRFGESVAISGDTVVVGAWWEESTATGVNGDESNNDALASGAAYVFVRDSTTWSQQAYLKASNTDVGDSFGWSVAISGDTVIVGACDEDSAATGVDGDQGDNSVDASGAAYVFVRDGTTWSQQAYLKASNTGEIDSFGWTVAISGETVVVGAALESSSATGVNGDQGDDDAPFSGAAYVFVRDGTTWSQQAYLKASNTGQDDRFGGSVAVSGDTIIVGACRECSSAIGVDGDQHNNDAALSGAAYVFVRDAFVWAQRDYLKASNTGAADVFGWSVGIDGDTVVVGAPWEDSTATGVRGDQNDDSAESSGAAYVFEETADAGTASGSGCAPGGAPGAILLAFCALLGHVRLRAGRKQARKG